MLSKSLIIFTAVLAISFSSNVCRSDEIVEAVQLSPEAQTVQRGLTGKSIAGAAIQSYPFIKTFYETRQFEPVWTNKGKLTKQAKELIEVIEAVGLEGLKSEFYHKNQIDTLRNDKARSSDLDIILTDAFFVLGSNLSSGLINQENFRVQWFKPDPEIDLAWTLNDAIKKNSIRTSLDQLKPKTQRYRVLRDALQHYKILTTQGGWPRVPNLPRMKKKEKMQLGQRQPYVASLRRRLEVTENLPKASPENDDLFDESLQTAVISFQSKNGLNEDGVVGKWTVDAMNVSAGDRVCQIKINLDRLRALRGEMSAPKVIIANIPAFRADVLENGKSAFDMRVIVGRYNDKSPLMSDEMETVVFAPKWHVPVSIAVKEELGKLQKDPQKFRRRGMKVYQGSGKDKIEIDYESHDWSQVDVNNFEYHFVQGSGRGNALGRLKFLFPNKHSVYMHDTPTKPLFNKDIRAFSHGCIRIQKPVEFAEYLLKSTGEWDLARIEKEQNRGKPLHVPLPKKIPVHLIYNTAWADDAGKIQFRRDVYHYDRKLKKLFCN
ncbi:MAG: L,D-transpeptidase family protein [Deltaproteobacteria bacterium]|nr:L,D-transpeptidase family protein [Deltaproteobacteria bacterium]